MEENAGIEDNGGKDDNGDFDDNAEIDKDENEEKVGYLYIIYVWYGNIYFTFSNSKLIDGLI